MGALLAATAPVGAAEVMVVLSAKLKAYQSALDGFRIAFNAPFDVTTLNDGRPTLRPETRLVVAIGGKAAIQKYPDNVDLICLLAPGISRETLGPRHKLVTVEMIPPPSAVIDVIQRIQPRLNILAVYHASRSFNDYVEEMRAESQKRGVHLRSAHVESGEDLPMHLRAIRGRVDGIWILPDPLLINPGTISILNDFSWANNIPLYVPIEGLPDKGAVASIASDLKSVGKTAARTAHAILRKEFPGDVAYPDDVAVVLNAGSADTIGLTLSDEARRTAKRVNP
jgi:ABC-type uncharacterized transport system substrate-binding protein